MNHVKHIWICVGIAAVGVLVLGAAGLDAAYGVVFVLPCVIMMVAMMWMMGGGSGGHSGRSDG